MDGMLDVLASLDGWVRLLRLQVRFPTKLGGGFRIPFHRQVVEDQGIDIANPIVSIAQDTRCGQNAIAKGRAIRVNKCCEFLYTEFSERFPLMCNHHMAMFGV